MPVLLFDCCCRGGQRYHSWDIDMEKKTLRLWGHQRQLQGVVDDKTGGIVVRTAYGPFNPKPLVPWPPALEGRMTPQEYRALVTELACTYYDCLLGRQLHERGVKRLEDVGRWQAAFVDGLKGRWLQRGVRLSFECGEIELLAGHYDNGAFKRMMYLHIDPIMQAGSTEIPVVVAASPLLESPVQGHSLAAPPAYASAPPASSMGSGGVIHVQAAPPSHTMSDDGGGAEGVPAASAASDRSSAKFERLEQENAALRLRVEQQEQAMAKQQLLLAELQSRLKEGGQ